MYSTKNPQSGDFLFSIFSSPFKGEVAALLTVGCFFGFTPSAVLGHSPFKRGRNPA
jgi:hypothetical protein